MSDDDNTKSEQIRNYRTPEGEELGRQLAEMCDEAEPYARLKIPQIPPRCASCAFRHGRHLANGSPFTQMDALKCVIEHVPFDCHEPARKGNLCSGWALTVLGTDRPPGKAPWPFSDGEGE